MKYVAVEGMTIVYTAGALSAIVTATLGQASSNVRIDGNGVYLDGLELTASSWQIGTYTVPVGAPVTGNFESSARKVKADGEYVLLEGDTAEFDVQATDPNTQTTQTFTITATVQSAGQTSVKAE
ncbi:hypothetical protein [Fibrobacter sp.]|uniref:hypothetical protein n=1 Tax=Fibrobacter sp. TaxID=35828 RepID=UPI003868F927